MGREGMTLFSVSPYPASLLKWCFYLGEIRLLFLHTALEGYDSKLPLKRGFHMHFLPSFFSPSFFSSLAFFFFPCSVSSVLSLFLSIVCLNSPPAPTDGRTFWMLLWRRDQSIAETQGRQNMRLRFRKPGVSSWLCH